MATKQKTLKFEFTGKARVDEDVALITSNGVTTDLDSLISLNIKEFDKKEVLLIVTVSVHEL
mgnify:CR=1 FL=1